MNLERTKRPAHPDCGRCGRCGCPIDRATFAALAPIQTLAREELAAHVVSWPEQVVVDVRACARCQAPVARLARA